MTDIMTGTNFYYKNKDIHFLEAGIMLDVFALKIAERFIFYVSILHYGNGYSESYIGLRANPT